MMRTKRIRVVSWSFGTVAALALAIGAVGSPNAAKAGAAVDQSSPSSLVLPDTTAQDGAPTVVSGSNGDAHYEIPIPVPPGPGGFAPKLSFQYSSRYGN